jgi:hypothetical protein
VEEILATSQGLCRDIKGGALGWFWPILSRMTDSRRHLSMLRSYTAADALTIGNASCGTIAISATLRVPKP